MGVSDSGFRCADENTETKEIAKMTRANRNNLVFMNWDSLYLVMIWGNAKQETIKKRGVTQPGPKPDRQGGRTTIHCACCAAYRGADLQRFRNATRSFFIMLRAASNSP